MITTFNRNNVVNVPRNDSIAYFSVSPSLRTPESNIKCLRDRRYNSCSVHLSSAVTRAQAYFVQNIIYAYVDFSKKRLRNGQNNEIRKNRAGAIW